MSEHKREFTKYERARIVGARGLQIAMDAPLLLKMKKEELEEMNYDPLKIAEKELDSGILPITVNKPMPPRTEENLKKIKIEVPKEVEASDEAKEKIEEKGEKEIVADGEAVEPVEDEDFEASTNDDYSADDTSGFDD